MFFSKNDSVAALQELTQIPTHPVSNGSENIVPCWQRRMGVSGDGHSRDKWVHKSSMLEIPQLFFRHVQALQH